jgi:alkylhydroperoxidase family enzyme
MGHLQKLKTLLQLHRASEEYLAWLKESNSIPTLVREMVKLRISDQRDRSFRLNVTSHFGVT